MRRRVRASEVETWSSGIGEGENGEISGPVERVVYLGGVGIQGRQTGCVIGGGVPDPNQGLREFKCPVVVREINYARHVAPCWKNV